ncbi:MAG: type IV pilin-like G/H family protein [Candidatus Omnitrophica bacterium]|nr:type IV pilin-like G/H family protein [Candidatus Omnitrophota bacterium]
MAKNAFTLIEIMIVVIIIAVLAVVCQPMFIKAIEKAKVGEAISNLNIIRSAQKSYLLEHNTFALSIDSLYIDNPNSETSRHFDYTIESADTDNFVARAQRRNNAPSPYDTYYYEAGKDGPITSNGTLI